MKLKKYTRLMTYLFFVTLFAGFITGADMPSSVKIITQKGIIDKVQYNNYDLNVEKIKIEGRDDIVYCLELDKNYPSGQNFLLTGTSGEEINNIIGAGYPNRTPAQLNLNTENQAYFATQIAIWSFQEGYDVNKITGNNPKVLAAIRTIYNDGISGKYKNIIQSKVYKTTDEAIQEVLVSAFNPLMSEVKAETEQAEYAPQEG
ncbi:thioester domain-containing protein [Clostridium sp. C2-6-12]|uniref:thioester domain-containing protein n=1 Tax=Clostridium sp. C2-6-12 TaxID=2698832 RepID=UPI001368DAF8|nr:thioester domain-containing protein [Clostridium sp. C2-6-12]